ncbi:MAG TPA: protein translocase subunit SecF [Myxococcales bacterium]|nr:protein translocase subunit SecF [Myxococcales bacterium]
MPFEIIPSGTNIDFIGRGKLCATLSAGLILISLAMIPVQGIRLGVDFAGGSEMQVRFEPGVTADEGMIRSALAETAVVADPSVVRFGEVSSREFLIKFKGGEDVVSGAGGEAEEPGEGNGSATASVDRVQMIEAVLSEGIGPLTVQRVDFVGPRVGAELRSDGLWALFWASLAILVYVTIRFSSRFAPGAVVAVFHDLLVTSGIFVILGLEFDLRVLAALLAIIGYSLNDTIIIYDRIRENMALRTKAALPEVLNESVNQTLSRTVLTSGTTLMALFCLYFLGGEVIRPFAFAMLIGVVVGTYSSIYIAAPLLLLLEGESGEGFAGRKNAATS